MRRRRRRPRKTERGGRKEERKVGTSLYSIRSSELRARREGRKKRAKWRIHSHSRCSLPLSLSFSTEVRTTTTQPTSYNLHSKISHETAFWQVFICFNYNYDIFLHRAYDKKQFFSKERKLCGHHVVDNFQAVVRRFGRKRGRGREEEEDGCERVRMPSSLASPLLSLLKPLSDFSSYFFL